jgi:NADH:ubiquinone oxidoreductase subunit K
VSIGLTQVLVASAVLLGIGAFGSIARRSLLVTLLGGQLMFLAGAIAFVAFGRFGIGAVNQGGAATMALYVGAIAVAQLGLGLAMAAVVYRERRSPSADVDAE